MSSGKEIVDRARTELGWAPQDVIEALCDFVDLYDMQDELGDFMDDIIEETLLDDEDGNDAVELEVEDDE